MAENNQVLRRALDLARQLESLFHEEAPRISIIAKVGGRRAATYALIRVPLVAAHGARSRSEGDVFVLCEEGGDVVLVFRAQSATELALLLSESLLYFEEVRVK